MRERLFRGRRMYSEEWIYSTTIFEKGDSVYMPRPNTNYIITSHADIVGDIWQIECRRPDCFYRVDPSTIGEYTGLTDKNGKKIFEGDIVKGFYKPTDKLVCGSVKYENHLARMLILNRGVCAGLSHCHHVEVIGNIHDNPELLYPLEGEDEP